MKLDETGADGLVPIRSVGREFFHYDGDRQLLVGADSGVEIGVGQRVLVRLAEATPVTGGLVLELLSIEDRALPSGRAARPGRYQPRKPGKAAAKARKVVRKRR